MYRNFLVLLSFSFVNKRYDHYALQLYFLVLQKLNSSYLQLFILFSWRSKREKKEQGEKKGKANNKTKAAKLDQQEA